MKRHQTIPARALLFYTLLLLLPAVGYGQYSKRPIFKTSLDTAKSQVLPFDIDIRATVFNDPADPIRAFYLVRIDPEGRFVADGHTSYKIIKPEQKNQPKPVFRQANKAVKAATQAELAATQAAVAVDVLKAEDATKAAETASGQAKAAYQLTQSTPSPTVAAAAAKTAKAAAEAAKKAAKVAQSNLYRDSTQGSAFQKLNRVYKAESKKDSLYVDIPPLRPDKRYVLFTVTTQKAKDIKIGLVKEFCQSTDSSGKNITTPKSYRPEPVYYTSSSDNSRVQLIIPKSYIIAALQKAGHKKLCNLLTEANKTYSLYTTPKLSFTSASMYDAPMCDKCHDDDVSELLLVTNSTRLIEANRKSFLSGEYGVNIGTGPLYTASLSNEAAKTNEQKLVNLKLNLNALVAIQQALLIAKSLHPAASFATTYNSLVDASNEYITTINTNKDIISEAIKANNRLSDELQKIDIPVGWEFNAFQGGTSSFNFYTRNSYFIKPDFGVIYYGGLSGKSTFSGAAPFVGFHINFRATNEKVPFWRDIRHNGHLWQLPTLQIGVPIFAQNLSQNESRKHLVADKFSLFTGLGLNLSHTARLHYGAVWFQSLSSVQNNERNYKLAAVSYLGFSIDIRLRKLFPGLSDAIFGVKDMPGL